MERIQRKSSSSDDLIQAKPGGGAMPAGEPGGRGGLPPQVQGHGQPSAGAWDADDGLMAAMGMGVQRAGGGGGEDTGSVHQAAAHGVSGAGGSLPHLDQIQKSFGPSHDVSGISSHVGGPAADACDAIGASAYASGNSVAFKGSPDLHTAAHEAAHVVQQKQGISLYGGVGVAGDVHEQHADAVADRVVAGQSAADLLSAGSSGAMSGGGVQRQVQRDEAKPADGDGAAKPAGDGGDKKPADATGGAGATGAGPSKKTVDVLLSAIYEEVPGDAKDKVRRATGKEAVWLDPLTMYSNHPQEKRRILQHGVVAGGGEQTVDTYQAPVTEKDPVSGRGSITSQLKYAADTNKSFSVTVAGVKKADVGGAEKAARTFIEKEIATLGDVEEIQGNTEAHLKTLDATKYDAAKVTVDVKESKTHEAGSTSFNYKVRTNAGIRMDLLAQPVGEKTVKTGGSKTTDIGSEDENNSKVKKANEGEAVKRTDESKYKKEDTSTELHDVDYFERVAHTLDDYVTKTTTVRNELLSDLAEKTVKHKHSDYDDHEVTDNKKTNHEDYTKDYKHTTEAGERDKENWAAKLRKGVKIVKDVTKIPFIDKIPGVGWFTRKVKGWQLDLIDGGLGLFEEKGKVKFTDVKVDDKVKVDGNSTDKTDRKRDVELTEDEKTEYGRKLSEEFKSDTKDEWERHLKDITDTSKTYRSRIQKDAKTTVDRKDDSDYKRDEHKDETENEVKHKERKNQTTTATFESVSTWKFSKPVVKATVVSGDAEVSNTPFGPEPGEPGGTVEVVKPGTP